MKSNKYLRMIPVGILVVVLIIAYLFLFFSPGVWYGNTFLYKKSDNSFTDLGLTRDYTMQMAPTAEGTVFSFTVGKKTEQYRVLHNEEPPWLQIYKNNALVYEGNVVYDGDLYMLKDADGNLLEIDTSGVILIAEDRFPTCSQLVNWSLMEAYTFRGNPVILCILIAVTVLLCLSYALPKLFRPSSVNNTTRDVMLKHLQKLLCGAILLLVLLSLLVH